MHCARRAARIASVNCNYDSAANSGIADNTKCTARTDKLFPTSGHARRGGISSGNENDGGKQSSRKISAGENRRTPRSVAKYEPLRTGDRPYAEVKHAVSAFGGG